MAEYLLSIDGGGTKTQAVVCDHNGCVIAKASGHGCNPQDNAGWAANLRDTIAAVLVQTGKPRFSIVGMPGYDEVPDIDLAIQEFMRPLLGNDCLIINDVELACRSAFPAGGGVLLLAGTGSMAMKVTTTTQARVGGWGDMIGDEGSAYWIGQRVLQGLSRAIDERDMPDEFTKHIADHIGVHLKAGSTELLEWLHTQEHPRSQIAALASKVDELAEINDPRAVQTMKDAAAELANLATTAHHDGSAPLIWAFAGSVFRSETLRKEVTRLLGRSPTPPTFDILSGGLWLAAQKAGWNPDEKFAENLRKPIKDSP